MLDAPHVLISFTGRRAQAKSKKHFKSAENQEDASGTSADASDMSRSQSLTQITTSKPCCLGAAPRVQELMHRFADHAYLSYMQGAPALSHLPLLTRYNVSMALQRNADLLGVKEEYFECEGVSPFTNQSCLVQLDSVTKPTDWPLNMLPTQAQRSKPHHPWIDAFPWPRMRDNMLEAFEHADVCDEDEMCNEVVEYDGHDGQPLLLVWGDASNPQNWEIGLEFLKKWVWLLNGCEGLLEATNYWRAKRGERPITQQMFSAAIERSMPPRLCGSEL